MATGDSPPRIPPRDRRKTRRGGIPHVQEKTAKSWPAPVQPGGRHRQRARPDDRQGCSGSQAVNTSCWPGTCEGPVRRRLCSPCRRTPSSRRSPPWWPRGWCTPQAVGSTPSRSATWPSCRRYRAAGAARVRVRLHGHDRHRGHLQRCAVVRAGGVARRYAAPLARRQRRAQPREARPAHAGPHPQQHAGQSGSHATQPGSARASSLRSRRQVAGYCVLALCCHDSAPSSGSNPPRSTGRSNPWSSRDGHSPLPPALLRFCFRIRWTMPWPPLLPRVLPGRRGTSVRVPRDHLLLNWAGPPRANESETSRTASEGGGLP